MSVWKVRVTYKSRQEALITVEADDYGSAHAAAQAAGEAAAPPGHDTFVDVVAQEGEPWVRFQYACRGADPTTIVLERATGHRFTKEDVTLLKERVASAGYAVLRHWNGEGIASVSIGCADEKPWEDAHRRINPAMDAEQARLRAILTAPRPEHIAAIPEPEEP